jgi:hypothetical protein
MRGAEWDELRVLRDLQKDGIGTWQAKRTEAREVRSARTPATQGNEAALSLPSDEVLRQGKTPHPKICRMRRQTSSTFARELKAEMRK